MISTISNHCDGGDGLLDLDVHSLENSRAWRHRLHRPQETKADLSPLVSRRQFNCKWKVNVQRQVPSPDRSHIRVRQLQRVLLEMVDGHQLSRPFHHVHLLHPQSTKVISYLILCKAFPAFLYFYEHCSFLRIPLPGLLRLAITTSQVTFVPLFNKKNPDMINISWTKKHK